MISIVLKAAECFILAVVFGLLPIGMGFALGWICRGEHDKH